MQNYFKITTSMLILLFLVSCDSLTPAVMKSSELIELNGSVYYWDHSNNVIYQQVGDTFKPITYN